MDERCKICRNACKRLDSNDDPVHYQFCNLTCADAIAAVEKTVVDFGYSRLKNAAREHSLGNQLAMIFRCNSDDEHGSPIVVIAQQVISHVVSTCGFAIVLRKRLVMNSAWCLNCPT